MLRDKTIIGLLLLYMLFQLGALFLGVGLFLFVYTIAYIIAIIYSASQSSKAITQDRSLKVTLHSLTLFFIVNIVLFLIYIPTLIYNPEINWKLKGEVEQDPMILQAYVPVAFFIIATLIILLTAVVTEIVSFYKFKEVNTTE